jgi:hypothetical protein
MQEPALFLTQLRPLILKFSDCQTLFGLDVTDSTNIWPSCHIIKSCWRCAVQPLLHLNDGMTLGTWIASACNLSRRIIVHMCNSSWWFDSGMGFRCGVIDFQLGLRIMRAANNSLNPGKLVWLRQEPLGSSIGILCSDPPPVL